MPTNCKVLWNSLNYSSHRVCLGAEGTLNLDYCLSHIYAWKESKPVKQEDDRENVKVWQML